VILHDGIKTIQNVFFPFSFKKNKILFLSKKQKNGLKKQVFLNPNRSCHQRDKQQHHRSQIAQGRNHNR